MKKILLAVVFMSIVSFSGNYAQKTPLEQGLKAVTSDAIKAQLGFLASDWTEGREAGERGEYIASDYIASILQLYGVKPCGDTILTNGKGNNSLAGERSYFQNFVLLKTLPGDEQILKLKSIDGKSVISTDFTNNVDFTVRPSDPARETDAPVVFAGYGYKNEKYKYNDFSKLDVKGKFVLRIAGIPKFIRKSLTPSELASSAGEIESMLKEMGAIGIIEFNPRTNVVGIPGKRELTIMSPSEETPRTGRPRAYYSIPGNRNQDNLIRIVVSVKTANEILKGTGINPDDYISSTDINQPYLLPGINEKNIYLKTTVKTTQVSVRNIIGIIEGSNPGKALVLGAHYDHLGMGKGYIWNGADDNGSGTVGVMTLAKAIMATGKKPENSIIIALWTAEEEGLLGSRYFIQNPVYPLKDVRLYVNFDMISRYISDDEPNKVTMTYSISCPRFKDITIDNLQKYGIDLTVDYQPSADPPGGTDHRSFVAAGIPVLRFKPGHREEYHTPWDEISTVNWDIMEKIIRISFADVWVLSDSEW